MCSDFDGDYKKYRAFSTTASLPLQWFLLTLYCRVPAHGVRATETVYGATQNSET